MECGSYRYDQGIDKMMVKPAVVVCYNVKEHSIHNELVVFVMEESYMYVSLRLFIYLFWILVFCYGKMWYHAKTI